MFRIALAPSRIQALFQNIIAAASAKKTVTPARQEVIEYLAHQLELAAETLSKLEVKFQFPQGEMECQANYLSIAVVLSYDWDNGEGELLGSLAKAWNIEDKTEYLNSLVGQGPVALLGIVPGPPMTQAITSVPEIEMASPAQSQVSPEVAPAIPYQPPHTDPQFPTNSSPSVDLVTFGKCEACGKAMKVNSA
ncbi:MAG: hypothetical protein P1V97_18755 [Planctomycetota bacterium]|nr:hypothetical protein [Planctomycetota bacterium]